MSDAALASSLVALCYATAGCLFIVALVSMAIAPRPLAGRVALAGLGLAFVTTLCTLDAISLPEMLGTTLCGGGLGWLIARPSPAHGLVALVIGLHGLVGAALALLGVAILLDPDALDVAPGWIGQGSALSCIGLGALGAVIAAAALLKGAAAPLAPLSLCAGAGAVLAGSLLQNWAMILGGAIVVAFLSALIVKIRLAAGRGLPIVHPIP